MNNLLPFKYNHILSQADFLPADNSSEWFAKIIKSIKELVMYIQSRNISPLSLYDLKEDQTNKMHTFLRNNDATIHLSLSYKASWMSKFGIHLPKNRKVYFYRQEFPNTPRGKKDMCKIRYYMSTLLNLCALKFYVVLQSVPLECQISMPLIPLIGHNSDNTDQTRQQSQGRLKRPEWIFLRNVL